MATPPSDGATPGSGIGPDVQYVYMFEENKRPTKQLDALLRAISHHIVLKIGDRSERQLTPKKLAAFYKAVGGDYDSIFIDMPDSSISYIWQVTGCQHTLQPAESDFAPPSIPALTPRGFSRWESVEILLGPEEHVPFLQYAVKNWDLRHPETGCMFPTDLPASVFPALPDADVDLWHKSCGERMSREAAAKPGRGPAMPDREPDSPDVKFAHIPSRNTSHGAAPRQRSSERDYFGRPFTYVQAPPDRKPSKHGRSSRSPDKSRDSSFYDRVRRRSFSDFSSPPRKEDDSQYFYDDGYLDPEARRQPPAGRRHSHPRHYSSDEEAEPEPANHRGKRRPQQGSPPTPSIRRHSPPNTSSNGASGRPQRSDARVDELRRRSGPSPLGSLRDKLTETVSSILPNGLTSDRSRPGSRSYASSEHLRQRKSREQVRPSRLSRSHSDLDTEDDSDIGPTDEAPRRRRRADDRDRERYRDRERVRDSDRDRDEDRDSGGRRERPYARRPDNTRRTSSHADIDRRREQAAWDARERDRLKEDRKKWDRERRSPQEESLPTPPLGASGRRYPEPAYT
ncbi:hypothetical protein K4F52_004063 [Lecanicillium sp. MT-2017a]|nr:hypothetical protein K4F52_004063 [Lecanicillium sp. MT-2017a]